MKSKANKSKTSGQSRNAIPSSLRSRIAETNIFQGGAPSQRLYPVLEDTSTPNTSTSTSPPPPQRPKPRHSEPAAPASVKRGCPRKSEPGPGARSKGLEIENVQELFNGEYVQQTLPSERPETHPKSMNGIPLKPHQILGILWMINQENPAKKRFGGILTDDTGLGKTVQSFGLIKYDNDHHSKEVSGKRTVVVVPNVGLADQWKEEAEKFDPGSKVYVYHGSRRTKKPSVLQEYAIVVTTYGTLRSEWSKREEQSATGVYPLFDILWRRVILDEAHAIRNPDTKAAKSCCALRSQYRWCLSATPLQNTIYDLRSLFTFLKREKYGDPAWFKREIGEPIASAKHGNFDIDAVKEAFQLLHFGLGETFLRRTKDGMTDGKKNLDIPAYELHAYECDLSPLERQIYVALQDKYIELVERYKLSLVYILALMLRLRQVCLHPKLLLKNYEEESINEEVEGHEAESKGEFGIKTCEICHAPLPTIRENRKAHRQACRATEGLLEPYLRSSHLLSSERINTIISILEHVPPGEKTIIFSSFTSMLDVLQKFLAGFNYTRYDGAMSKSTQDDALEAVKKDPSMTVILMSLKAGGVGLNLTECNHVILADTWWNPAVELQAIGRVHRIGQTRQVHVYRLVAKDTIETRILQLQEHKSKLAKAALEGAGFDEAR
ncbi:hypothetical protein V5O48_018342, partial [Marasmius crinis-equi]